MTVIFSKSDDTLFLQRIWSGIADVKVIEVENLIDCIAIVPALRAETECVILCGHGTPSGLLHPFLCSFIVGDLHVDMLRGKSIIGIWCYAAEFADYHSLSGFFSSMFISDVYEARSFGYKVTSEEIEKENNLFADRINSLIKSKTPVSEWEYAMSEYRKAYDKDSFTYFNYCGLVSLNESLQINNNPI